MSFDVVELRDFYASPLGQIARRMVRRQLRALWPDLSGLDVVGVGYAVPYLRPFRDEARRVLALMPAGQGVERWPAEGRGLASLVEDIELPLADASVDRLLVVHGLEHADAVRPMLREIWRILAPEGKLLLVVPHRRSPWAARESTPFGHGHPYSRSQLARLLNDCLFAPGQAYGALYFPPFALRAFLRSAGWWENVGRTFFPGLGGVIVFEATKRIYALTPHRARKRVLMPSPAEPFPAPVKRSLHAIAERPPRPRTDWRRWPAG